MDILSFVNPKNVLGLINEPSVPWLLALLIIIWAFYQWVRFRIGLSSIAQAIRRASQIVAQSNNFQTQYETIRPHLEKDRIIGHCWRAFEETLILPYSDQESIRYIKRPIVFFNQASLISARINLRHYQAIPNMLVGIGLLFTFIGLIAALYFASQGFEAQDTAETQKALSQLLHAATFKFVTSVAGLLASLIFAWREKNHLHRLQTAIEKFCQQLELRMAFITPEQIAVEQLKETKDQHQQLERLNTDLAFSIAKALEQTTLASASSATLESMKDLVHSATNTLAAIESMHISLGQKIGDLRDHFGAQNQDALEKLLREFISNLKAGAGTELEVLGNTLQILTENLRGSLDFGELQSSVQTFAGSVQRLEGVTQKADATGNTILSMRDQFTAIIQQLAHATKLTTDAAGHLALALNALSEQQTASDTATEQLKELTGKLNTAAIQVTESWQHYRKWFEEALRQAGGVFTDTEKAGQDLGLRLHDLHNGLSNMQKTLEILLQGLGERFGKGVDEAGGNFRENMEKAAKALNDNMNGFANSILLLQKITEQAANAGSTLLEVHGALQTTAKNLNAGTQTLTNAVTEVKTSSGILGQQGQTATEALHRLADMANKVKGYTDQLTLTWDQHQQRFSNVDQSAAKMFQEINQGLNAYTSQIRGFVQELDQSLVKATDSLGGVVHGFTESVDELNVTLNKLSAVKGRSTP